MPCIYPPQNLRCGDLTCLRWAWFYWGFCGIIEVLPRLVRPVLMLPLLAGVHVFSRCYNAVTSFLRDFSGGEWCVSSHVNSLRCWFPWSSCLFSAWWILPPPRMPCWSACWRWWYCHSATSDVPLIFSLSCPNTPCSCYSVLQGSILRSRWWWASWGTCSCWRGSCRPFLRPCVCPIVARNQPTLMPLGCLGSFMVWLVPYTHSTKSWHSGCSSWWD